MIIDNKYTIPHTYLYSDMDYKRRIFALSMVNTTQNIAAAHYSEVGMSMMHLHEMGKMWVITKQKFEFFEYPLGLDKLALQTWAHEPKGLFCIRDYKYSFADNGRKLSANQACVDLKKMFNKDDLEIKDENLIMKASSMWMVIDQKTGRPIKTNEFVEGSLSFCEDNAIEGGFSKIALPEMWDFETTFSPNVLDIDMNKHVNNFCYCRWILSYMDIHYIKDKLLKTLETNFVTSALFGDELISRYKFTEPNTCVHSIIKKDGTEIFRARTTWAPEDELVRFQGLY